MNRGRKETIFNLPYPGTLPRNQMNRKSILFYCKKDQLDFTKYNNGQHHSIYSHDFSAFLH